MLLIFSDRSTKTPMVWATGVRASNDRAGETPYYYKVLTQRLSSNDRATGAL
jgi:hypothetical protein